MSDARKAIIEALRTGMLSPAMMTDVSDVEQELCDKTLQRMAAYSNVVKYGQGL